MEMEVKKFILNGIVMNLSQVPPKTIVFPRLFRRAISTFRIKDTRIRLQMTAEGPLLGYRPWNAYSMSL